MQWPDLTKVLDNTAFAVVGAVATRLYAPERSTRDLDVVVVADEIVGAREKLQNAGWRQTGELPSGGSSWRSSLGEEVDLLVGREIWWLQAIGEAQSNRDAQGLPILPLPYLVLMKFQSGRTIDIGDIARMLGQADENTLDLIRALFTQYEPDGLEDLESLVQLGRLELQE